MFWILFLAGIVLVLLQIFFAWQDGYLSQAQMRSHGATNGWSILEHGGMWADVFYIAPMTAYFASTYTLGYLTWYGILILVVTLVVVWQMGNVYAAGGKKTPEAHTHDGYTTPAGWIHGIFAVGMIWTLALVYVSPALSDFDLALLPPSLTVFFFIGVTKFSRRWRLKFQAMMQILVMVLLVWGVTILRAVFF